MPSKTAPLEWRWAFLRAFGACENAREAGINHALDKVRAAQAAL